MEEGLGTIRRVVMAWVFGMALVACSTPTEGPVLAPASASPTAPSTPGHSGGPLAPDFVFWTALNGSAAVPIGQVATLMATKESGVTSPSPDLSWELGATSTTLATLEPGADCRCQVRALAPGPIHLKANWGQITRHVLLAGVPAAPHWVLLPGYGPQWNCCIELPNGAFIIRSRQEWARYWASVPNPLAPPDVDWEKRSVVLVASTGTGLETLVLTTVEPEGAGRVVVVRPEIEDGLPVPQVVSTAFLVYETTRLPASATAEFVTCQYNGPCAKP